MQKQRMDSPVRLIAILAIACFVVECVPGLGISIANAQRPRPRQRTSTINMEVVLTAAPREVLVLLQEAEQRIKNEQWSEATFTLGILLGLEQARQDDLTGVDFFLDREELPDFAEKPAEENTLKSSKGTVFQRAYELIESLPAEATKIVDLRYGSLASQMLDNAIAESNWGKIANVVGKYGFTSSGQDASLILGEHWLRKGDARRAARVFSRVIRQKSALERLGPELGILTAAAFQSAGMLTEALSFIEATRTQFNNVDLNWKGTKISWDARSVISKNALEQMELHGQQTVQRVIKQPYYLNGNASRNADTNAGIPLPTLRWHAELHESQQHKDNLDLTLKEKLVDGKSSFIPSRSPISVGPWVITTTYDQRIVGIDAKTGLKGFECPYSGMPIGFSMDRYPNRDSHSFNLPAPDYLSKRVWGETLLGAISSDGERIYNISELPALDISESFALGPNARVAKPQGYRSYNVMQCWSVREEGKAKWEVGGQKSQTEPKLAGTLFLGAPLPHENELLVLGELNSDLYLFALTPETGKLIWRQPITTNYSTISSDLMRRSTGAMPAADGAIIICPTISGYLVAYDKANRSMLWAFKYPIKPTLVNANQFSPFGQMDLVDFSPLTPRSADTSVVISNGVVLFAPSDGDEAYGIKIDDGTVLWRLDNSKVDQIRYVAGAWKDIAIIVSQTAIAAVDLKTGVSQWPRIELPNGQQVIGRGVRKEGTYFLPTSGQTILQIDLASGKVAESVRVEQPLGNMISVGDRLICATPFELDCYSVREAFQTQLKEELQRNSVSPIGLAQQGELALAQGDFDGALNFLDRARKIDPNNAEVILLINKAGIAALTADFDRFVDRVDPFENLAIDRDRVPFLHLLVNGFQKQGRHKDTLSTLIKLSNLRTTQRQEQMSGIATMFLTPNWSIQEDRWIATQVRNSMGKMTQKELEETKPLIAAELKLLEKLPSHIRRVKLGHFESIRETEPFRLESAKTLVLQKDYLQAERLLTSDGFLDMADPKSMDAIRRKEILASIYVRTNRVNVAARYLDNDLDRLNTIIREIAGGFTQPAPTSPVSGLDRSTPSKPIGEWPTGKVQVTTSQIDVPPLYKTTQRDSSMACRWKTRIGDSLTGWEISSGTSNLVFSNGARGEEFQIYADIGNQEKSTIPIVYSVDSIVVLEINRQLIVVDTLKGFTRDQEGVLWREQFEIENVEREREKNKSPLDLNIWGLPTIKGAFRVASVTRNGIIILLNDELSCLDLTTGAKVWTRTGFKGCTFASHQGKLLVHHPKNRLILHLNVQDGATLSEVLLADDGWSAIASIGRYWLMAMDAQKQYGLRLVDSVDGKIVFDKEFSVGTKIAIDGETGIIILQTSGELTYWNLEDEKEFVRQDEHDLKFNQVSVQRFGDTMLVMQYSSANKLDKFNVGPDVSDPTFTPIAGRLLALSAKDVSNVWDQSSAVRQFHFPIAQNRNSPVAVFLRILKIPKVVDKAVDFMSIAMIDIRNGHVLYSRDDLPVIRGLAFSQEILADQNTIVVDYLGTRVELNWTKEATHEEPVYDFGYLEFSEFKKRVEAKAMGAKSPESTPTSKLEASPNK